jgi:ketosteroid isomerase-like protein
MMQNPLPPPVHGLILGGLAMAVLAVSQPNPQGLATDEARIRAALADWVVAANPGDRHRSNQIWAKDLVGYYPGQPNDTYEREIAAEKRVQGPLQAKTSLSIIEIMVSGDMAVVHDVWRFTRNTPNPAAPDSIRGFEVWRKQKDESWKISRWLTAPFPK